MPIKHFSSMILGALLLSFALGCSVRKFDPNDSSGTFQSAKATYDDGSYELAINELREFIAHFPYSQYTAEAELLIANSYFELMQYEDAVFEYEQFLKLHPSHPQLDFVMFRIGDCYWKEAPEDVDREQEFTKKAISEWQKLLETYPQSKYTKDANANIALGVRRVAESEQFIAHFYCKQGIYHACAQRYLTLLDKYSQFPDIRQDATKNAAGALVELAEEKKRHPDKIDNLFFRDQTAAQLAERAKSLVQSEKKDNK